MASQLVGVPEAAYRVRESDGVEDPAWDAFLATGATVWAPVQRLYNLLCLAYGENPDAFSDVVDKGYLPKSRAPACKQEWGEVDFAFQKLIYPYIDRKLLNDVLSKSWAPDRNTPPPRMTDVPQSVR